MALWTPYMEQLGVIFDKDVNQIKIILCFFVAFFLSYLTAFIKSPNARYFYSVITGFIMNVFMFEEAVIHPISMLIGTYLIMRIFPRDKQQIINFVFLYTYLSAQHIHRMVYHYGEWGGEITSFTMNLVCRLTSVAFCYCDGTNNKDKDFQEQPSFMWLLGYTYNTPSCLAGPFFEFKDYKHWILLKGDYANIPSTFKPGFARLATALLWMCCATFATIYFKPTDLATEEFCNKTYLLQLWGFLLTMNNFKYTYYVVFVMNDSALIASGLAWNPHPRRSNNPDFKKVKNIDEWIIDTGYYLKWQTVGWNISISVWLKRYVFKRLNSYFGGKPGVKEYLLTFLCSAFWHGFYPCYYFFFSYFAILLLALEEIYDNYSWYFMWIPQTIRRLIGWMASYIFCCYIVTVFALYDVRDVLYYFNCQNWLYHIIIILFLAFSFSPAGKSLKRSIRTQKALAVNNSAQKKQDGKKKN
ncbi:unnamed protein product [Moneuplotes crassus]|uniref:Uncharacterized protein n=1 Tax=Euplotes crassus TaxID=5936 RepID=A0AAD1UEF2_EUPCR|nr:unnamed protein product [Moneuplotes crassus]